MGKQSVVSQKYAVAKKECSGVQCAVADKKYWRAGMLCFVGVLVEWRGVLVEWLGRAAEWGTILFLTGGGRK